MTENRCTSFNESDINVYIFFSDITRPKVPCLQGIIFSTQTKPKIRINSGKVKLDLNKYLIARRKRIIKISQ